MDKGRGRQRLPPKPFFHAPTTITQNAMEKSKAGKTEEYSKPTSLSSQDLTVIWMAEPKPEINESRHVSTPNGDVNRTETTVVMGSRHENEADRSMDRAASSKKSVHWSPELVSENAFMPSTDKSNSDAYRSSAPSSSFNFQDTVSNVRSVLGIWGKKFGEASKSAADLAGNTWQHLKTSPSITEATLGRITQGTKFIAEGGYEKIFRQTFETVPEEKIENSFACYLSTSAGPVMGILYVSTAKLAYCSDNPLPYKSGDQTEWSYYKVVIPLHQIKAVIPSSSRLNDAEKYIQVISVDSNEFWFMGFLTYDGAVRCLEEAANRF